MLHNKFYKIADFGLAKTFDKAYDNMKISQKYTY